MDTEQMQVIERTISTMIKDGDVAKLGVKAFAVYAVVAAYVSPGACISHASFEIVAEKTGMTIAQVEQAIAALVEHGCLEQRTVYVIPQLESGC